MCIDRPVIHLTNFVTSLWSVCRQSQALRVPFNSNRIGELILWLCFFDFYTFSSCVLLHLHIFHLSYILSIFYMKSIVSLIMYYTVKYIVNYILFASDLT